MAKRRKTAMKKIAIIGAGPTGFIPSFSAENKTPLPSCFEQRIKPAGMPYSGEDNSRLMLANIASIEIPPIFITYLDWLKNQLKRI
jgi:uncharacterized NAD(P)/FAD-binding protein YdhS